MSGPRPTKMIAMKPGAGSGLQIAFLTFAVILLAAPLTFWILRAERWSPEIAAMIDKAVPFVMGIAILASFPGLRRICSVELNTPLPREKHAEVAAVTFLHLLAAFAWAGAVALWYWIAGGEGAVAHLIRQLDSHDVAMSRALVPAEMVRNLMVIGLLAPLTEELVFRGLLYRAWEAQWGWFPAMLASSALFAVYHPNFVPAFVAGIIYVCLYRRTGSIWAPIMVHAAFNILLWYPLLGQRIFPRSLEAPGDLQSWGFHLAALLVTLVAIPAYISLARFRWAAPEPFPPIGDGALPR
jgi:membrane protease YdiL (CAAX protease family)